MTERRKSIEEGGSEIVNMESHVGYPRSRKKKGPRKARSNFRRVQVYISRGNVFSDRWNVFSDRVNVFSNRVNVFSLALFKGIFA